MFVTADCSFMFCWLVNRLDLHIDNFVTEYLTSFTSVDVQTQQNILENCNIGWILKCRGFRFDISVSFNNDQLKDTKRHNFLQLKNNSSLLLSNSAASYLRCTMSFLILKNCIFFFLTFHRCYDIQSASSCGIWSENRICNSITFE